MDDVERRIAEIEDMVEVSAHGYYADHALEDDAKWLIDQLRTARAANAAALEVALRWGGIDGAHHKMWTLDQVVRALTGSDYDGVIADACAGEDGPNTYDWETGTPP